MNKIGVLGEELVSRWLELQNYMLLQQNWRCRWGEIDIIAQNRDGKTIAFVEVKTRSRNNWDEGGLLAVDATKQKKIIQTASLFLAEYPQLAEFDCRFDVALVSYKDLTQFERFLAPCVGAGSRKRREDAKDIKELFKLKIGRSVNMEKYRLTIENYIQSAFELA